MRADMFKVVVERPRWGAGHAPRVKLRKDRNPDRKCAGHKRYALENAKYTKCLNENLAPLKRYLQKQRGRLWDDVYSEICAQIDTRSTVKTHVRDHIEDLIAVRILVTTDGQWFRHTRCGGIRPLERWWPPLYVDPDTKRIKETRPLLLAQGIIRKK